MAKNLKNKVMLAAIAALAVGNVLSASASASAEPNSAEYSGYVTKTQDYVSDDLIKTTVRDDGTNIVDSIDEGSWCSWIGNYLGMQVTDKVKYNSPDTYYMEFQRDAQIDSSSVGHLKTQLHVSTTTWEFSSTNTSGTWSPDTIN
mgnify:CR=1 FL=1